MHGYRSRHLKLLSSPKWKCFVTKHLGRQKTIFVDNKMLFKSLNYRLDKLEFDMKTAKQCFNCLKIAAVRQQKNMAAFT